jgi:NAD(P)-dependent dehydrogenase (short-subunit alcohol dehydrogenase family)
MKTILITGGTEGIGRATVFQLAKLENSVFMLARDKNKAEAVIKDVQASVPNATVGYFLADLSSLTQVYETAYTIKEKLPTIDVLINNAGLTSVHRRLSTDGLELTFAVNHLSHVLLTNTLLENIRRSEQGRIIMVSSKLHERAKPNFFDLQMEKNYSMMNAYNCSKLYNIYYSQELSKRLLNTTTTINSLHPGLVNTEIARDIKGVVGSFYTTFIKPFFLTPEQGSRTSVHLAMSEDVRSVTGKYFVKCKEAEVSPLAKKTEWQEQLWDISEELLEKFLGGDR